MNTYPKLKNSYWYTAHPSIRVCLHGVRSAAFQCASLINLPTNYTVTILGRKYGNIILNMINVTCSLKTFKMYFYHHFHRKYFMHWNF